MGGMRFGGSGFRMFASPVFGPHSWLQSMLRQTQALEDRLLQLNAERNELEAESARMPTHTTGRTQQVGHVYRSVSAGVLGGPELLVVFLLPIELRIPLVWVCL